MDFRPHPHHDRPHLHLHVVSPYPQFSVWYPIYPLVICYIAIEYGPFIVELPIKNGDFPYMYVSLAEGI